MKTRILLLLFFSPFFSRSQPSSLIEFNDPDKILHITSNISIYEDKTSSLELVEVIKKDSFVISQQKVPNLGISPSVFWIKLSIKNNTKFNKLIFGITYPILDEVSFVESTQNGIEKTTTLGDFQPFGMRKYKHQNLLFDVTLKEGESKTYYLKVKSWEQIVLPLIIGTPQAVFEANLSQDLVFGLFFGIMLVLILYNLFIYFTVKDSRYLYYVVYIFFITLTQAVLNGYTFRLIFSDYPNFTNISLVLFNSIAGLATIVFVKLFLKTKINIPTLNKGFILIAVLYVLGIITVLLGFKSVSYHLMDLGGMLIAFFTLFIAIKLAIKGERTAKIFLLAWSIFLLGVIMFVLKNLGILPSNDYTNYTMTIGISIEGILLSIALADRINIMRKEKEAAQEKTVEVLTENKKIITEQNIVLEQKVEERTGQLNKTLSDLKETQSQLVQAEKMSSFGQLTAGIAHEINNPINFVSSNIAPLRQDLNDITTIINKYEELNNAENTEEKLKEIDQLKKDLDYDYLKTELKTIIDGIEDGAKRTTEIVSGLRNFSRLDEDEFKITNINEGIQSTLNLMKNQLDGIEVLKNLSATANCECNPGKINQLIMNLIDNAIYSIHDKNNKDGEITISTHIDNDAVVLTIKDNGVGIPDEIMEKLFDPFFTTKDVGKGTGLGLSIVRNIIEIHNGSIKIASKLGVGTTIHVEIPIKNSK